MKRSEESAVKKVQGEALQITQNLQRSLVKKAEKPAKEEEKGCNRHDRNPARRGDQTISDYEYVHFLECETLKIIHRKRI